MIYASGTLNLNQPTFAPYISRPDLKEVLYLMKRITGQEGPKDHLGLHVPKPFPNSVLSYLIAVVRRTWASHRVTQSHLIRLFPSLRRMWRADDTKYQCNKKWKSAHDRIGRCLGHVQPIQMPQTNPRRLTGNHVWSIEWHEYQWPWVSLKVTFVVAIDKTRRAVPLHLRSFLSVDHGLCRLTRRNNLI